MQYPNVPIGVRFSPLYDFQRIFISAISGTHFFFVSWYELHLQRISPQGFGAFDIVSLLFRISYWILRFLRNGHTAFFGVLFCLFLINIFQPSNVNEKLRLVLQTFMLFLLYDYFSRLFAFSLPFIFWVLTVQWCGRGISPIDGL